MHERELNPPLSKSTIFDVKEQWQSMIMFFDFSVRSYDKTEAKIYGTKYALVSALECFWLAITPDAFCKLCSELLEAEGVFIDAGDSEGKEQRFDILGQLLIKEVGGFRRTERWGFQFKNHQDNRVTVENLREFESYLAKSKQLDVICLITSGDLTSIGKNIAVSNQRLRIWDRDVLNRLVHKHLEILEKYFTTYPLAIKILNERSMSENDGRLMEFTSTLANCPPGHAHFSDFEQLGTEIWSYLFADELAEPKVQQETRDRVERRDVLFRNLGKSEFFKRVANRLDADFIIVDFKNHSEPIDGAVIKEVSQYANKALGRLIILVSRKGQNESAAKAQRRLFEKDGVVILSVSDALMLEMLTRKESNEDPADILSDLLDELLIAY
jgi:Restriction endonuclease